MAAFDYQGLRGEVRAILAEFGATCTVSQTPAPVVDAVAGTVSGAPVVTQLLAAVVAYDEKMVDGSTVRRGDRQAVCEAPEGVELTRGGTLTDRQGRVWNVVDCEAVDPADVTVVYILQLRR